MARMAAFSLNYAWPVAFINPPIKRLVSKSNTRAQLQPIDI